MNRLLVALPLLVLCAAGSQDCQGGDCTAGSDASVLLQNGASLKVASAVEEFSDSMSLEDALAQEDKQDDSLQEDDDQQELDAQGEEEAGAGSEEEVEQEDDERPVEMVTKECQKCIDDIWTKSVANMKDIMTVPAFQQCKAGCEQASDITTCRDGCRQTAQGNAKKMFNTACPVCSGGLALDEFLPSVETQLSEEAAQVASFLEELDEEDTIDEYGNMITHDARLQLLQEEEEDKELEEAYEEAYGQGDEDQEPDEEEGQEPDEEEAQEPESFEQEAQEPDEEEPEPTTPDDEPASFEQEAQEPDEEEPEPTTPDDEP